MLPIAITERLTLLPFRYNVSESWENDVFFAIWTHSKFRLYITHLGSNSSVVRIVNDWFVELC